MARAVARRNPFQVTMSDKPKKEEAAPDKAKSEKGKEEAGEKPAKAGLLSRTPVLLGIAMVVEAVVLFAGFKFLGGSPKSAGAEVAADAKAEGDGHEEKKPDEHAAGHDAKKTDDHEADAHADPHADGGHAAAKVD